MLMCTKYSERGTLMTARSKQRCDTKSSDWMPQDDASQQVLALRAARMSEVAASEEHALQLTHYVCFRLGEHELYGVPYQYIEEVMLHVTPTRVPNAPDYITGVINRSGMLISVLDLKAFFHLSMAEHSARPYLIIVSINGIKAALLADNIEGSDGYNPSMLETALSLESAIEPKYILGLDKGVIAILNVEALLMGLAE